eukprot:1238008-Heterocapsa_arctica.AAC.1
MRRKRTRGLHPLDREHQATINGRPRLSKRRAEPPRDEERKPKDEWEGWSDWPRGGEDLPTTTPDRPTTQPHIDNKDQNQQPWEGQSRENPNHQGT